jgi:phosphate starvation-inducible PhoH-like protein
MLIARRQHKMNLTPYDVEDIFDGDASPDRYKLRGDAVIVHGNDGKPIKARNRTQEEMVKAYFENDLIFAVGPAGTGKTYIAIALAVRALKNREIKRIILTRPAVEAGERLGFLPGDLKDKLDPYLQPLYDALGDMIPAKRLQEFMTEGTIQIAPLAYMRGRTLDRACVILDEAQNTNLGQLKMFLTRMGCDAKFIVTGDASQIDLPNKRDSGLLKGIELTKDIKGIKTITFRNEDIVRHPLVTKIVKAFEKVEQ